ncbi:hypothetical protein GCM10027275_17010 [Rhabdobacter roseus]|uniref:3-keto-alpha-glucoside-1,2-lyase/3-keto-2-hydroxy-glucal hydratase domain-containing protein n=1 Tax=Rhabdobacter roseus TaxID=1655419 RepID=A0A840TL09_9BACT|nr:DUF1080 domain-containing protein [Rhabdobacter roseus]MBB5283625.1 hypothetical protein [Rhabdobacter roseus]
MKCTLKNLLLLCVLVSFGSWTAKPKWISLFNGKDLTGWTSRGDARWSVRNGVLVGEDGRGHLYAAPVLKDLEVKGEFRISSQGKSANSGLYVRANEPADNPNGFPQGYEAQICHTQDAHTGWLWKPGKPTGQASALLTKDDEWFPMRVRAVGNTLQIWIKDQLVMTHQDDEYPEGKFAIQCHNPGMRVEARNLYYQDLSKKK